MESHVNRPSKRRRFFDEDDMDCLQRQIDDIKERMGQIADHLRADVDPKLEEILYEVRQLNDI